MRIYFVGVHCLYLIQIAKNECGCVRILFQFKRNNFDFMLARCQCIYAWLRICSQQSKNKTNEMKREGMKIVYSVKSVMSLFLRNPHTLMAANKQKDDAPLALSLSLSLFFLFALSQRLISDVDFTLCTTKTLLRAVFICWHHFGDILSHTFDCNSNFDCLFGCCHTIEPFRRDMKICLFTKRKWKRNKNVLNKSNEQGNE